MLARADLPDDVRAAIRDELEERRRFEASLGASEERYRLLFHQSPVGIVQTDERGIAVDVNEAFAEIVGGDREGMLGFNTLAGIRDPDLRQAVVDALAGRPASYEGAYRAEASGNEVVIRAISRPLRDPDGAILGSIGIFEDITERRRVEEALAESKRLYEELAATIAVGVYRYRVSADGTASFDYASPRMCAMLGQSSEAIGADPFLAFAPCHPDDLPDLLAANASAVDRRVHFVWEGRFIVHGETRWYRIESAPTEMDSGEVIWHGIVQDVTDRRLAEEALAESLSRYDGLVAAIPIGVFRLRTLPDGRARFEYASPRAAEILGTTVEGLLASGDGRLELAFPEDLPEIRRITREAVQGRKPLLLEGRFRIKGETRWLRIEGAPGVESDGELEWSGIVEDVTEAKRAADAVRRSEERFALAMAGSRDGLWDWDLETGEVYYSPQWKRMVGYEEHEIAPRFSDWERLTEPEGLERAKAAIERCLKGETDQFEVEFRMRHKEGRWVEVLSRARVVRSEPDGRATRLVGTHVDLSELRRAEAERRKLEEEVLHAQRLESLRVLAGGVAHDFNNLLTAVLANTELALLELPPTSALRQRLQGVERAAARGAELAQQMLAYSGRTSMSAVPMSVSQVVRDTEHLLEAASEGRPIELDLSENLPRVRVDAAQVSQALVNLVLNAHEALGSAEGGIEVRTGLFHADAAYLSDVEGGDAPLAEGDYVSIAVRDGGPGMDPATRARAFEPFFSTKFAGRGLGLAATLGIVRGHGGGLKVESAAGKGTTVTLLLPPVVEEGGEERTSAGVGPAAAGRLVLVVDDEEMVRSVARASLESRGHEVVTAGDGFEGLATARERFEELAAVVLDLTMPGLSGAEVLRALHAERPSLPVILCSGYSEEEATGGLPPGSFALFLQKPFRATELLAALERVGGEVGAR